jgi:hypothetical protein
MSNDKQTALQQLKSTIKDGIGNMNGQLNDYKSGYKQCLIDIENLIDKQLLEMEREQIEEAFQSGKWDWAEHIVNDVESKDASEYYNEKYGGNK